MLPVHKENESRVGKDTLEAVYKAVELQALAPRHRFGRPAGPKDRTVTVDLAQLSQWVGRSEVASTG